MFSNYINESKVINTYKDYYILETWYGANLDNIMCMQFAYNNNNECIGDPEFAYELCNNRGITPEKISPKYGNCTIGFCEKEQKWYGWSHESSMSILKDGRIRGFGIRPGSTLEDAKQMAINFANSVS